MIEPVLDKIDYIRSPLYIMENNKENEQYKGVT